MRAVVVRDGHVLLVQRSADEDLFPNVWQCPAGGQEAGESVEETLARELLEETGLALASARRIGSDLTFLDRNGGIEWWEPHNFLVEVGPGDVRLSHEHQAFAWLPLAVADRHPGLSAEGQAAIRQARRTL
ncbi:MAG: NUDIX domain-containing protein [Thermoleophilia bacterium]